MVANQQTAVSQSSPVLTVKGSDVPVQTASARFEGGTLSSSLPDDAFASLHSVTTSAFSCQITGWVRYDVDTVYLLTSNAAIPFLQLSGATLTPVTDGTAASTTPVAAASWAIATVMAPQLLPQAPGRHLLMAGTATPTYTYTSYSPQAANAQGVVSSSSTCSQTTNGCPLPGYNASWSQCTRCACDDNCHKATHTCVRPFPEPLHPAQQPGRRARHVQLPVRRRNLHHHHAQQRPAHQHSRGELRLARGCLHAMPVHLCPLMT